MVSSADVGAEEKAAKRTITNRFRQSLNRMSANQSPQSSISQSQRLFQRSPHHLANHSVALAVDVELAGGVDRQPVIAAALLRNRLPAGQVFFLPASLVVGHLID